MLFQEGAIVPWPGREVLVVVDHDPERRVGRVLEFRAFDDAIAGRKSRWLHALAEITDPPPWLRRGTGVSFCHANLGRTQEMPGGWSRALQAFTDELTLCSPAFSPLEPPTQVVLLDDKPAVARASAMAEVARPTGPVLRDLRPGAAGRMTLTAAAKRRAGGASAARRRSPADRRTGARQLRASARHFQAASSGLERRTHRGAETPQPQ